MTNYITDDIIHLQSKVIGKEKHSMHKSLYSLMLSDSVIEQIDKLALRENSSRSSTVNRILAEYVSMLTPEMRIAGIFKQIEEAFLKDSALVPCITPNSRVMSLKSSLQYKYRPTVKYEVTLYRSSDSEIGELSVVFRTQSPALLQRIGEFFLLWKQLEEYYFPNANIRYVLYGDKLVRGINPTFDIQSVNALADAISEYVSVFDELMKYYITSNASPDAVKHRYVSYLNNGFKIL